MSTPSRRPTFGPASALRGLAGLVFIICLVPVPAQTEASPLAHPTLEWRSVALDAHGDTLAARSDRADALPIQVADYDRWASVGDVELSRDGRWVSFAYDHREEDQTLVVRNLDSGDEHEIERGENPTFSRDGRWLAFLVPLPREEARRVPANRRPAPREAGLLELATGERWSWEDAQSVAFAPGSSHLVVRKRERDRDAEHEGAPTILRNLREGYEELLGYVHQIAFDEEGTHLAWTVSAPEEAGNGVYLMDLSSGARRALDNGGEGYRRLTWNEEKEATTRGLAVLRSREAEGYVERENVLLVFPDPATDPTRLVRLEGPAMPDTADADGDGDDAPGESDAPRAAGAVGGGLPEGTVVSEKHSLEWSPDGARVFFGFREQRSEPPGANGGRGNGSSANGGSDNDNDTTDARADVDIWHWADDRIQSVQQVQADRDRNRTHLAVLHLDGGEGRVLPLTDDALPTQRIAPEGRWVVAEDPHPYVSDWEPSLSDYHRVDPADGERHLFLEGHLRSLGFSPDGERFLYWKDEDVWAYELGSDEHRNLTAATRAAASVTFVNEEYDRWGEKPPHGVSGWAKDDRGVILETRFDLWLVPLDGGPGRSVTEGRGEAEEIRFRYQQLDEDEKWVDLDRPILLTAFGERDKRAGFYRLAGGELEELVYDDAWFGRPRKAAEADRLLFTRESFREFPDLWTSDTALEGMERVTAANPHEEEYRWGRRILFDFVTVRGDTLQGTLAIPDDYVEGERRPMLVNFYERNSQNLNRHPTPTLNHRPQFARFVSHGYLVMQPDIALHTGDTHTQMKDAVLAATEKVIEMGYADPDAIGLHGHSFSGQGSAYIATQTDRFAAILPGAAATNLVSDFNQLWKTAGTNQHRYDTYGQGRFATNPFDDLDLYISQSALHNARGMNTPLLILHGTEDGSVEWLQAVEFYNALRFLGKPVIMLSYPGEGHGLRRDENRTDFQIRMHQFFDHHLKGAEAPAWMLEGVPHLDKPYHAVTEDEDEDVVVDADAGGSGGASLEP